MAKMYFMSARVGVKAALSSGLLFTIMGAVLFFALSPGGARAHELRPSIMDVTITGDEIVMELEAAIEPFLAGIDQAAVLDTSEAPEAASHDTLREQAPADLENVLRQDWPSLAQGFTVTVDGAAVPLTLGAVTIPDVGDIELPRDSRLTITGTLPVGDAPVTVGWVAEYGALVVRQGEAESGYSGYLTNGDVSLPLPRTGAASASLTETVLNYIVIGFEHIIPKGLDHILFVLGLFFFSFALRPLVLQITTFTAAHTLTLALATLGYISVPASVVEPLIAASIAYIALENILVGGPHAKVGARRIAVVGVFGLLHGLGFASVLGEIGLSTTAFLAGLIAFNVGVEIGQLTVIGGAALLVGLPFGRKPFYRRFIAIPVSVFIGVVGAYWAVERVFF